MRRTLSPPEARLWTQLKAGRLMGLHFRKQHPLGPYVIDFYCAERRLAVEVDGLWHGEPARIARDERRDAWLLAHGVATLRVAAEAVRLDLEWVVREIADAALGRPVQARDGGTRLGRGERPS